MNNVVESPQEIEYIANWKMPEIKNGEPIVWMPDYQKPDDLRPAWVNRVSMRSIECIVFANGLQMYADVRHKDDPQLPRNHWVRQNGAWDYSNERKDRDALEERVKTLEEYIK